MRVTIHQSGGWRCLPCRESRLELVTYVILVVLALAWAAFLLPPLLRNRPSRRRARTGGLGAPVLPLAPVANRWERGAARAPAFPAASLGSKPNLDAQGPSPLLDPIKARERRRNVLLTLAALALVTLIGAFVVGGPMIVVHLFVDLLLLGYVVLLVQHHQRAQERRAVVRPINARAPRPVAQPVQPLRPAAGEGRQPTAY